MNSIGEIEDFVVGNAETGGVFPIDKKLEVWPLINDNTRDEDFAMDNVQAEVLLETRYIVRLDFLVISVNTTTCL